MSASVGATVANLYYNQPLLSEMKNSFGVGINEIAWIPTLTQMGYAAGMLFLVPLGDMLERRRLVVVFTLLSAIFSAWTGLSQSFYALVLASFCLGVSTMTPQLLIPFAAHLAPADQKGKVVGTLMSGLLLGILLARTVSGFIGSAFGWRVLYDGVAIFLFGLSCVLLFALPKSEASYQGSYRGLLSSVAQLFLTQATLRESAFLGALLFASFSAFWSTLIHLMEAAPFHLGANSVGLFGLLGAGAASLGPWTGNLVDRKNPRQVVGFMIAMTFFSFLIFAVSARSLLGIGLGVLLMDIGVQSGHISNQRRIFSLVPGAQSRIQTVYMFFYFVGGALGSYFGNLGFNAFGWLGVCGVAIAFLTVAGFIYAFGSGFGKGQDPSHSTVIS